MESTNAEPTPKAAAGRRPLFWWPITLFTLTLAMLFVAGRVSAWHGTDAGPGDRWRAHAARILDRMLADIDASEEQAARIRTIADETLELVTASHASDASDKESRDDGETLRALITADPPDRAALEALRSEHLARADALSEAVVAKLVEVLEVLTPEQRQQLAEKLDEHRAHHHGPHAGRHGGPGHQGFFEHLRSSGARAPQDDAPRDASGV